MTQVTNLAVEDGEFAKSGLIGFFLYRSNSGIHLLQRQDFRTVLFKYLEHAAAPARDASKRIIRNDDRQSGLFHEKPIQVFQ